MALAGIFGFIEFEIFAANGWNGPAVWAIVAFTVILAFKARPSNSNRRIPNKVRRRVIANYERKKGIKYSSRTHELDHKVPFSKGGGHTVDNLRVIEKSKNRSKGAKLPWWDIVGKIMQG